MSEQVPGAGNDAVAHECDTGHFDRTICPEPCGYMHSYCATCGVRQDPCAHDSRLAAVRSKRTGRTAAEAAARLREAVEGDVVRAELARLVECVIGLGVEPAPGCNLCLRTLPCPIHVGQAAADAILAKYSVLPSGESRP